MNTNKHGWLALSLTGITLFNFTCGKPPEADVCFEPLRQVCADPEAVACEALACEGSVVSLCGFVYFPTSCDPLLPPEEYGACGPTGAFVLVAEISEETMEDTTGHDLKVYMSSEVAEGIRAQLASLDTGGYFSTQVNVTGIIQGRSVSTMLTPCYRELSLMVTSPDGFQLL